MQANNEMQQGGVLKAINILWDVDEEDGEVDLPDEVIIPDDICGDDDDEISDYLSDLTGFCHKGYDLVWDEPSAEQGPSEPDGEAEPNRPNCEIGPNEPNPGEPNKPNSGEPPVIG